MGSEGQTAPAMANDPKADDLESPILLEQRARAAIALDPDDDDALRLLSRALYQLERSPEADAAAHAALVVSVRKPINVAAIRHLTDGRLRDAEALIRRRLAEQPEDALALMMMGDLTHRLSIYDQSENFLRRSLAIAPAFEDARLKLVNVLHAQGRTEEALAMLDGLLDRDPGNLAALDTCIRIMGEIGEYDRTLKYHEMLLRVKPDEPRPLVGYANTLKTVGRSGEAIQAYRRAIALDPGCSEAWWALSNMKARQLDAGDIARMESIINDGANDTQRMYLHFALGKAHEDSRQYEESFHHYAAGNLQRLKQIPHDPEEIEDKVDRAIEFFDADFFARHAGGGAAARDPIFIVGMPRAGSTLLEQILASHSQIEGTAELPEIPAMIRRLLGDRWRDVGARYPDLLDGLTTEQTKVLGDYYLSGAAMHRKENRPFFIDKLPINWLNAGFIRMVLPNATIIDARREPMACCFANFKQHFARGQTFAYSLSDVGHYYSAYVRLMTHFDRVLPHKILRLQHEDLLDDPETEIRRLLDGIGLPFEDGCLRFHENARAVRTPSAEQVRKPLNRDAVDLWRNYEPWLDELKQALGPLAPNE